MTSLLPTSVGETREQALNALRPGLAFYAGFCPRYNRLIAEHGFAAEAGAIAEAWARRLERCRARGQRRTDQGHEHRRNAAILPRAG